MGCTLSQPDRIKDYNLEPEVTPLHLSIDFLIYGLRQVANSGGSFDLDVEYALCQFTINRKYNI